MGLPHPRGPVRELGLRRFGRFEAGVDRRGPPCRSPAHGVDHGLVQPPARPLKGQGPGDHGPVKEAEGPGRGRPHPRLAQVVDPAPQELACVLGIVPAGQPGLPVVPLFRADDLATGLGFPRGQELAVPVVGADHIQQVGQAVVVVMADIGPKQALGHGPCRVVLVADLHQPLENGLGQLGLGRVVNLVAHAPQDHARVVPVTADRVRHVDLGPLVEEQVVVEGVLGHGPAVEELVHDQEPHPVAQVQELRGHRVVGRAHGIGPDLPEPLEAPLPHPQGHGSPESASVVVQAHAPDPDVLAVEPETALRPELGLAYAEGHGLFVDHLVACHDLGDGLVQVGLVQVPEPRSADIEVLDEVRGLAGGHGPGLRLAGLGLPSVRPGEEDTDPDLPVLLRPVPDHGLHPHGGLIGRDLRGGHEGGPRVEVHRVRDDQADVAVDPCARVPTGGGLPGVVRAHGQDVQLVVAQAEGPGQLIAEAHVPEGPLAQGLAVDPDLAVGHDPVELHEDPAAQGVLGQDQVLAVPAHAPGQESARTASGVVLVEGPFNAPVVRHIHLAPRRVVELRPLPTLDVGLEESPVRIQGVHDPRRDRRALRSVRRPSGRAQATPTHKTGRCGQDRTPHDGLSHDTGPHH